MGASATPTCKMCGKLLRRYRYRNEPWGKGREWGDHGDGFFCTLRCGYAWAVWYWKQETDEH